MTMRKLAPLLILAVIGLGCATGTVTTSTGAIVSAGTMQAQNGAGDWLKVFSDAYVRAVAIHDSPSVVAADSVTTHASRHLLLMQFHDGLVASYAAELAWKAGSNATSASVVPAAVLCSLGSSLTPFLAVAVDFKLITQAQSDSASAFAKPILATVGGCQ
jgi:hypothetical protein